MDVRSFIRSPFSFRRFFHDWREFQKLGGDATFSDLAPKLFDRSANTQSGGGHYFYQDVWALRQLSRSRPAEHHDFGSRLDGFVAQATAICPVIYWDIRAPNFRVPDFHFREASLLELPIESGSVSSVSCLHVVEHIGLGRYGDPIDPEGAEKALRELERILAPGGQLLFSMPVGRERVEFNAQRIWNPTKPAKILSTLQLLEFSVVTDEGEFLMGSNPSEFVGARYCCGLYRFVRNS
jgi:SAM-dependent methyltransferase